MKNRVYDNRELSWLKFNLRVLEEAEDPGNPLMERMMFQSIYASNLDEFFMVRVGSIYDASLVDDSHKDNKSKMRPSEQLSAIFKRVRELVPRKDESYKKICRELEGKGISHKSIKELSVKELEFLEAYYAYEIRPFINALIIDKRHPFPFLENKTVYAVTRLSSKSGLSLGIISCGDKFKRIVWLPRQEGDTRLAFILVEEVISYFAAQAFPGYKTEEKTLIRVTRNADIDVDECFDRELDFRQNMSELIKMRRRLCPVRLQMSRQPSDQLLKELTSRLELQKKQVFVEKSPLDMSYVWEVIDKAEGRAELFFEPREPQASRMIDDSPMISQIEKRDLFLSYPYESIAPFIRLLNEAANDPEVVSIKMTLYRVAKNSKVVKALCTAAENGKEVIVLVELRARFDEENNIGWSKLLEECGCRVMYGPQGLKVHSKLCLITRRTAEGVKYTVQIGTGNYNEKTAKLYTDLCLMTSNNDIAADAEEVFRTLSVGELVQDSKTLMVAPYSLQNKVLALMDNEIAVAKAGGEGYVGAKLNSLTDKVIIDKLIECSQAGVKVELVIRGISCLIAGVEGVTDNITIRSIVGRYLEHARIYIFGCGVRRSVYISSADYMTRNTTRRVEVASPILDEEIRNRILMIFETQMKDNCKARVMKPDGSYERLTPGDAAPVLAQNSQFAEAYANVPLKGREAVKKPVTEDSPKTEKPVTENIEKAEIEASVTEPEETAAESMESTESATVAPETAAAKPEVTEPVEPESSETKKVKKNKVSGAGSSGSSGGKKKKKNDRKQ